MEKNKIKLYNGKAFGETVSGYGLKNGYLDYYTLSKMVGPSILNNYIRSSGYPEDWELVNGNKILEELTDEIVYYNNELDIYIWGITHFGTSWEYVLTDVKIIE